MLARYTKTADELGITDAQLEALIKVLDKLERGELREATEWVMEYGPIDPDVFSMRSWCTCIRGHAHRVNGAFDRSLLHMPLSYRTGYSLPAMLIRLFSATSLSMSQATNALRLYLTTGKYY
jgi:hypothetical protein